MKKILLLLTTILSINAYAQTPPPWEWVRENGSTGNDQGYLCARDFNNNVYVTGYFSGTSSFGSNILTSNGGNDAFIAKYNASGALLWVKQIGGSGDDSGFGITVDSAGTNIFVTGWYTGTVLFDATSVPSHGPQDAFIAKYNSSGVLQWVKHGGSTSEGSRGLGVAIDRTHQYLYATGHCGINSAFDATTFTNPYCDSYLAKYDVSNGALVWARHDGGPSDDYGVEIATDHFGHVYLAGYCKSTSTFDAIPVNNAGPNHSNFLAKYDSGGNVIWVRASTGYGGWNKCVAIDSAEATIYVYGDFSNTTYYGSTTLTSYGMGDLCLASYDSSGALNWAKQFGGPAHEVAGEIALDRFSNIYLAGIFSATASFIDSSITSAGGKDAFVAKLDPAGTLLWIEEYGGAGDDEGQGMSINNDGSLIYLSGSFVGPVTFGSFLQNGYGNKDAFVVKLAEPYFSNQNCITLQPDSNTSEYATITTLYPNGQYGDSTVFQCSAWTISGTPYLWNSLMKFDLSAIPTNAVIDSAFISLYGYIGPYDYHSALSGSNDSKLVRITSPWNEVSVTWNTQPTITTVDSVLLPMSNTPGEDFLHYDIKNMVQYWANNPSNNYGLMYKLNNEQYYRRMSFHSPESPDSTKHPKLEICYHVGPEGISEVSTNTTFTIYPNPSSGNITIALQNAIRKGAIEIFNSIGQQVYSEHFENLSVRSINLNQSAGIYFVKVTDGEKMFTQKLIIQ